ncbi:hypothetical protein NEFER03_0541 [Nematocida sp. LUAm3]|nr:hypothetical protein NEFER03_0541 [Nematocida sp. LUAm3]KAI5175508.1 hypothetical protein NEFER02_1414 [Nematocida sp. LUAm2]KAI5178462.1 hypothetical protein NEFER01_1609 [Nematocida sp. LUAm1]
MQKTRSSRFQFPISILTIIFLLILDLYQVTSSISEESDIYSPEDAKRALSEYRKIHAEQKTSSFIRSQLNVFSRDDLQPNSWNTDYNYPLIFNSYDDFKIECKRLLHIHNHPISRTAMDSYKLDEMEYKNAEQVYTIPLKDIFQNILNTYKTEYPDIIFRNIHIRDIINNPPTDCLTGKEAALYLFEFLNMTFDYIVNTENYISALVYFQNEYIELNGAAKYKDINNAKNLLNFLFTHAKYMTSFNEKITDYKYILCRVQFSQTEKINLIRYCEFILSCILVYKDCAMFQYPNTQARLKKTEKELSEGFTILNNYYSIYSLYRALFDRKEYINSVKKWILGDQKYDITIDQKALMEKDDDSLTSFKPSDITNTISLLETNTYDSTNFKNIKIIDIISLCGTEGTVEIQDFSGSLNDKKFLQFRNHIKNILLNKNTKIVFKIDKPTKVEELSDKGYKKVKEQRENIIVQLTKKEEKPKILTIFFWIGVISTFGLFVLSIFTKATAAILPILLPVIIFTFALFVLYTLSQKENKIRKTSILRGVPIATITFLALYIISTFVITDMNSNPLILKTVQFLLLSEFSLVVLFGLITSGLIIKSVGHIKKRFRARLRLRIVIYALSILLLLLPLIMILIGYKTDAMLLIRSDIMVFSSILFFIGALLEDQNYNESELQAKRGRNRKFTWAAIALFAILLIICISVIYLCSLNKPFDAVTEVTKESSLFYRFFSSLPMNFYPTSEIPNTP